MKDMKDNLLILRKALLILFPFFVGLSILMYVTWGIEGVLLIFVSIALFVILFIVLNLFRMWTNFVDKNY